MIGAIFTLLACQLAGEIASQVLHLPVPGPVLGMVLLVSLLVWCRRLGRDLEAASGFLLRHLSLFFVPAAVGVMVHGGRIAREWLPLGAAILVSTALTLAVTGVVFQVVARLIARDDSA
jgi:holin-like protein